VIVIVAGDVAVIKEITSVILAMSQMAVALAAMLRIVDSNIITTIISI
tara:strand:+ start:307 stop:450 length:144 start_codon:yes stop_codon:yes gene_type:complete